MRRKSEKSEKLQRKVKKKETKSRGYWGEKLGLTCLKQAFGELCTLFPINNFSFELLNLQV